MRTSTIANHPRRRVRMRAARVPAGRHPARRPLALAAACLVFTAGSGAGVALAAGGTTDAWPQFGHDAAHLGVSSFDSPQPPFERQWRFAMPAPDRALSAPVVAGDTVIALSTTAVYGVDVASGRQRWRVPRDGGSIFATPAVAEVDGTHILLFTEGKTAEDSALVAFSLEQSDAPSPLWRVPLRDRTTTGVSVDGDTAFTGDFSGNVAAVEIVNEVRDADTERDLVRWEHTVPGVVTSAPAVAAGKVVAVSRSQSTGRIEVDALDETTGKEIWTSPGDSQGSQATAVTIDGERVLIGFGETSGGGVLVAIGLRDGLTEWSTRFSSPFLPLTDIVAADGRVLALGTRLGLEAGLYRVDVTNGRRATAWNYGRDGLWTFEFDTSAVFTSPVLIGDSVVLGFDDGRMAAVDVSTGVLVWRTDTGEAPLRGLAAGDGVVVASVGSRRGGIVAFRSDPGSPRLAEVSSSKPEWGEMLANYGLAFAGIGAVAGLIGLLMRPRRETGVTDAGPHDDADDLSSREEPA